MKKGYKDTFSIETHKVEDVNRGLHTVDGSLHTRKDLQPVKGNVMKAPTKTKAQQKQRIQDKVGKSLTLDITVGNPNVMDVSNYINAVLKNSYILSCDYFNVNNKFIFTRLTQRTPEAYDIYINPLNAGRFLGFKDNIEVLISFNTTTSTYPININSITALSIGINGDISFSNNNMESNLNNSVYKASDLQVQEMFQVREVSHVQEIFQVLEMLHVIILHYHQQVK